MDNYHWRKAHPGPPWECWYCGDPINAVGRKSWSLAVHHINGLLDHEALAPVHYCCHNEIHEHSKNGHESPVKGRKRPWFSELLKERHQRNREAKARIEKA